MTPLSCAIVLEQLEAFYDGELPVDRQIAVSTHLDHCESCGAALADVESLGLILRAAAPGRVPLPCDEAAGQVSAIVNRAKVEDDASFAMRVRELFDDRHVLYAGLGAAAATVACLVIMLGMMRFATKERSDSLAGMLNVL
jgi:anti-sigma factor RsiW